MKAFSTYIEYLLMTQHFVFVPGLGAFMLREEEAQLRSEGHILPPQRTVQFNRFISHDDGLLANLLMSEGGLTYDEANARIRMEVAAILNQAQRQGRSKLGHLGLIFFDQECHISFRPADIQLIDPFHFGLRKIAAKPWQEAEADRNRILQPETPVVEEMPIIEIGHRRDDVILLPKVWLRRACVLLFIVTFFFANFLTIRETSITTDQASMLNSSALRALINHSDAVAMAPTSGSAALDVLLSAEMPVAAVAPTEMAAPAETSVAEVPVAEVPSAASNLATTPKPQPMAATIAAGPHTRYYVIIGSCPTLERAQILKGQFEQRGLSDLGIISMDNKNRVYIKVFDTFDEAKDYNRELRKQEKYGKAWILRVAPEDDASLSLIIKKKDNDHLPMELSHLNKPTERDKG